MITLNFDDLAQLEAQWATAVDELGHGTRTAVDASTKAGKASGRVHAPHRSYALRNSIDGRVTSASTNQADGEVSADAPYAPIVEEGSRAHEIAPHEKQVLRFQVDGVTVFTKKVRHPGTRPHVFMDRAEDAADRELADAMDREVENALERLGR